LSIDNEFRQDIGLSGTQEKFREGVTQGGSHHAGLVDKTLAEALIGKSHPHWLELLGYQRFQRTALAT
jgi:hypothetical protein